MLCLLLTLLAIPVAYSLFDDLKATSRWRRFAETVARESSGNTQEIETAPKAREQAHRAERDWKKLSRQITDTKQKARKGINRSRFAFRAFCVYLRLQSL